ncbi:NADH-quinone oxidoreductase subunit C [Laceyella putida]|uniref:NADH-quinone oxidoreductase subunit C n=1 Tax=Laceyella putida TaxID=110101 RepID=A0ABW2RPQ1_9BACL
MEMNKKQLILEMMQQLKKFLSVNANSPNETVILIEKADLPEVCRFLCKKKGGRLFTMVGSDERNVFGSFALYYVFSFDKLHHFITVKTFVDEADPSFPTVAVDLPAANWYEREVKDLLGLRPQGHPDPRPLVLHGDWPEELHPLRKEFPADLSYIPRVKSREVFTPYESEDVTEIPVGPIHAGIIEPGHFRFGAVGDTVLHLDAKLFYTHRGLEKVSEGMPLRKALFLAERICGVCALSHAVSFAQAVENVGQVEISARAKYLRTLFLELERLYNHIGDVGNVCTGFGFAVGVSQGSRLKEEILQLNERIVGHRYLRGVVDLGGMRVDVTRDDCLDIQATLQKVETEFKELVNILFSHDISINRMATTGVLTLKQVNDLEVVGIAARASGRNIDVRRNQPYAAYDRVHFNVPIHREGDVLARVRVRIDEVFQSISIVQQVLEQLPSGNIVTSIPPLQPYQWSMGWTESPRGETVHWLMTGPDQTVYRYRVRSATYSNWPSVPLAVKGNIVPDFPLINKSFELCYACCDR